MNRKTIALVFTAAACLLIWRAHQGPAPALAASKVLKGKEAFTDYTGEKPGVVRHITVADLPQPFHTPSATAGPRLVPRPEGAWPETLPGFKVSLYYAEGLQNPRMIRTAPNGDLFLAESAPGRIRVFRGFTAEGKPQAVEVFAAGLNRPFGIAFYPLGPNPQWVYVANTNSVVRFPYRNGDLKARGPAETVVPSIPAGGGHWTRDIAFSLDGKTMFVSVGSRSNVDDPDTTPAETDRAAVLAFAPDGSGKRTYAYGIRNAVGIAVHPQSGELWVSVNERDGLGDDLVPDYITHVREGGFYGWPWFYLGPNQDPRHQGKRPDLRDKVIVPDVLLQAHLASLGMVFYGGRMFPAQYRGGIFAAEHGSWNRARRVGYKIIFVPMKGPRATGEYMDFVTGFVASDANVWGRPVAVAVARDGSLVFSDDGSNSLWRVTYGK
jgi:glucose/arabinose dehydrogenase